MRNLAFIVFHYISSIALIEELKGISSLLKLQRNAILVWY